MDLSGFEPEASSMPRRRSSSDLRDQKQAAHNKGWQIKLTHDLEKLYIIYSPDFATVSWFKSIDF